MQKITPFLWFDREAEVAAKFYTSIFKPSKITHIARYGDEAAKVTGMPSGTAMTVGFELRGQRFTALNGGPIFKFNESVSLVVNCDSQREIDYYWEKLSAGGDKNAQQCGWLKDKFGLSWQIVPSELPDWLSGKDPAKADRVVSAVLQMKKLDVALLKAAYAGRVETTGRRRKKK